LPKLSKIYLRRNPVADKLCPNNSDALCFL